MPFIGNQPALSYTSFAKQDFTTSATTSYTLDNPVANANELALFINFVRQEPTTAYSANSTTLTLTEATSASDDMYCVYLGKAVQTVNPPNSSVGTAQLVNDSVTKDKVSNLMYPAFRAYLSSDQTGLGSGTLYKVTFQSETYDTDNCFDSTTNYRFTPTVAGKYFFNYQVYMSSSGGASNIYITRVNAQKNGSSNIIFKQTDFSSNPISNNGFNGSGTVDMNGSSDYLEIYARGDLGSGTVTLISGEANTFFEAYRIGD